MVAAFYQLCEVTPVSDKYRVHSQSLQGAIQTYISVFLFTLNELNVLSIRLHGGYSLSVSYLAIKSLCRSPLNCN